MADETGRLATQSVSGATVRSKEYELCGVRLRDVYRDRDGELWEVTSLCDKPIAGFTRVKDGKQVDHVIGCPNMKAQFPNGGGRV